MAQTPRGKGRKIHLGLFTCTKGHPGLGVLGLGECSGGAGGCGGVHRVHLDPRGSRRDRRMVSTKEVTPAGPCPASAISPEGVCF